MPPADLEQVWISLSKHARIEFDGAVHSLTAIKKAAYRLIDKFTAEIRVVNTSVVCDLHFAGDPSEMDLQSTIDNFRREVLDQDLREHLKKETEQVRNLILAHAFSKTGISSNE